MHIPVQAGTAAKLGIGRGEEQGGERRRDVDLDEGIADGGEKHFVNVQREGWYAKVRGEWFRDPCEQRRWREWKRVQHFGRGEDEEKGNDWRGRSCFIVTTRPWLVTA